MPASRTARLLAVLAFAGLLVGLFTGVAALPRFGDPDSPPSTHVSPRYVEAAREETGALNMVTAVLADYRGYDTLGETAVVFVAGLGCLLILGAFGREPGKPALVHRFGSDVLDASARTLVPWILLFALYVLVHGHVSPGGGFQGGVLFGSGLIALRLIRGGTGPGAFGPGLRASLVMAALGLFGFCAIGLACILFGGQFLNYGALPLGSDPATTREIATLVVEGAVFVAVSGTVMILFHSISAGIRDDEPGKLP